MTLTLFQILQLHYEVGCFTFLVSLKSYFLASQLLLLDLICYFLCFIDGSRVLKEQTGIVCQAFKAFSKGCILLELKNTIVFFL